MKMATDKDHEQDVLIQQNAEHIRRNEEAIRRQTECLEKIRDHYFPKPTFWKSTCGFFLKVIGAVTVGAGLMETFDWYRNERQISDMAAQSAEVARRLMFEESDMAGAMAFLEKAVELEGNKATYRTMLAYVKGMAAVADLFDVGRPLTPDERARVDAILSEAVFLQSVVSDDPMPFVLTAQAYVLRREFVQAGQMIDKAIAMARDKVQVRCSACAIRFFSGDLVAAKSELDHAKKIQSDFPLVLYWEGLLAATVDGDHAKAHERFGAMVRAAPRLAMPHAMLGWTLMSGDKPDCAAARVELTKALDMNPRMKRSLLMMGESYEKEGKPILAKLWYDRALACDARFMKALLARTHVNAVLGDWKAAVADLTTALEFDPFRADLRRERAKAYEAVGDAASAASDRKVADAIEKGL